MTTITDDIRTKVVARAEAQVGKAYVFGSTGPDSYDCSGSVLEAWKPWVVFPHNSGLQLTRCKTGPGTRLVKSSTMISGKYISYWLKPGDLAFFYGNIDYPASVTHVATYIGWHQTRLGWKRAIVNATNEEMGVEIIGLTEYAHPIAYGFVGH